MATRSQAASLVPGRRSYAPHHNAVVIGDPEPGDRRDGRPRIDEDKLLARLRAAHGPHGRPDLADTHIEP
jgi:hypothetical protein